MSAEVQVLEGYRLSPQQERLFVLYEDAQRLRLQGRLRLNGAVDEALLRRAFAEVVTRHEALRTSFQFVAGKELPLQVIEPQAQVVWEQQDSTEAAGVRVRLVDGELWVSVPALSTDRRGLENLVQEVSRRYERLLGGGEGETGEPVQYLQYAEWQNELLAEENHHGEQWVASGEIRLPLELEGSPSEGRERERLELSGELLQRLEAVSELSGSSVEELLLSSWYLLLWRLSGAGEVTVEVELGGRKFAEMAEAIGCYAQAVPVACVLSGTTTLHDLFRKVSKTLRRTKDQHEHYDWRRQYGSYAEAATKVGFSYSEQRGVWCAGELEWKWEEVQRPAEAWKLELRCERVGSGLRVGLWYAGERYERAEMKWLAQRFERVVEAVASGASVAAAKVELLSASEREQQVVEWNRTALAYPSDKCVQQLFEQQVAQQPEALAVIYEEEQLTYAELNARANQLAHQLRALGVGPEVLVGICVERSVEMIVGLLGIVKAGGGYLPLDPLYPRPRLEYMLADAGVEVLLTQRQLLPLFADASVKVLCVDEEAQEQWSSENPVCVSRAENVCYVTYTSGSTGQPKGVLIPHRGVTRLLCNVDYARLDETRVLLQLAPLAFDASTLEVWGALVHGGCCVLWPGRVPAAAELREAIGRHGVTTMWLTASLFNAVVDEEATALAGLEELLIGGEALSVSHVRRAQAALPGVQIINGYGPTESTTFTCCERIGVVESGVRRIAIGKPIANTEVYVVDEAGALVPVGVVGELYIGGAGLGRGYLQRPELTAEKFVPDGLSGRVGERLYRTGDLVRYLSDGKLEFVGRVDEQVKVRGHRIELGEVEAVLSRHSAVKECVVIVREDEPGDKRLVAYLTTEQGTEQEWRSYLQQQLPEYMIPSAFVELDQLPLNRNGKVDRQALPPPAAESLRVEEYQPPRTAIEELVAGIWSEVLKVGRVGRSDNFFALGGHSLLATQVVSRVRKLFAREVPLRLMFESQTLAEFAIGIEAMLAGGEGVAAPAITELEGDGPVPLSFAQQRLWFIDQLDPGNAFYNVPTAVRFSGELNLTALEGAFSEVVRRHEALRTSFTMIEGEPVQVIAPAVPITIPITDTSDEAEARRFADEEARRPFDLNTGPVLRVKLLRLAETEHVLLCTLHHIVSDGWSMGLLVKEVTTLYRAFSAGEPSPLPELTIQYADFAAWQREWLSGDRLETQLAYWKQQLQDAPALLELPTDRPRPLVRSYRGAKHEFRLSENLSASLKELARREGATLFMVLLAAFDVLLSRYSGQEDIVVGTDIANRNRAETEQLIGFFVNQLVLRTDLSGNPSYREVLRRVREVALGAYAHQDIPFEKLVEELQPERDLGRSPLFQVLFVVQNAPVEAVNMPALQVSSVDITRETARFDLFLAISETNGAISGVWTYRTDLFDADTITRLDDHFQTLLQGLCLEPDKPVASVPMLSEVERRQQILEWNATSQEYKLEKSFTQLFEAQVARNPEAVALVYEDRQLTYGELNARSNQLAHHLRQLGVGPEVLVGIFMERSLEMVVGLLGILKAGGAYVPLEPAFPMERLAWIIEDAGLAVLLTQDPISNRLPTHWGQTLYIDTDWPLIAAQPTENPASVSGPENLCYVIYTSGSTGKPKGVLVPQRALVNYCHAVCERLGEPLPTSFATVSTFAADLGHTAIFPALSRGGALHVIAESRVMDAQGLANYFTQHEVECLKIVPSHLRALYSLAGGQVLPRKVLIVGGEATRVEWAREWQEARPECRLVNHYGPTECTVGVLMNEVSELESNQLALGRPLRNTQAYVLNTQLEVVPVGAIGELYIGGDGVARGYLNRPEFTAQKFIPDPFSGRDGARLYRTGDLVRYRKDGRLAFVGRADEQVKVRGYRIELGEIEATLNQHPKVKESVVVATVHENEDKRLVAYVVRTAEDVSTDSSNLRQELRTYLEQRLPAYMIPGVLMNLAALPLTLNGKIDRRALPAPETQDTPEEQDDPPRTGVEELIAGIWSEVLQVKRVARKDNFFELGGHSLLATQVVSRVREVCGVEVGLRQLFEKPRLSDFGGSVEEMMRAGDGVPAPQIQQADKTQPLPLSFAQQRLWFVHQLEPNSPVYNVPLAVRLSGALDLEALKGALSELVRRHEVLRTSFAVIDGEPVQVIAPPAVVELPIVKVGDREQEAQEMADEEARRPFDLSTGPMLRVQLLRLADEEHVLLCTMHHIVSDGWSMGLLVKEVTALYRAFAAGEPSPLPELTIQYADFAAWQRQWLSGSVLDQQLAYWKQQLQDAPALLELPTDRPRPLVRSYRGAKHEFRLSDELSAGLKELARREGATLFMVLLAAFDVLLARYSGQEDIVVGTDIANRNRAETEQLIGFFVNQLVLRTDVSGNPSYREVLRRVREVTLGAYAHQDIPFEKLVEELQPERDLSRSPLFQVQIVLQNIPREVRQAPGPKLSLMNTGERMAKVDLLLLIVDGEENLKGIWTYNTDLFDAATVARMQEHFETLLEGVVVQPESRVSALKMLVEDKTERNVEAPLQRAGSSRQKEVIRGYRLSRQQRRWLELYEQGERLRVCGRIRVSGRLELDQLARALEQTVQRHEALRTSFHALPGMELPLQVIGNACGYELEREAGSQSFVEWCAAEQNRAGTGLRVVAKGQELWVSVAALCSDARGLENLVQEVSRRYGGSDERGEVTQYADYAEWQSELLADGASVASRAGGELLLPLERAASPSEARERERLELSAELLQRLEAVGAASGHSVEELLLGSWYLLLWRLSGATEVTVEVELGGRKFAEMAEAIGCYAQPVPVRLEMAADYQVSELLELLSAQRRRAEARQEYYDWVQDYGSYAAAATKVGFSYREQRGAWRVGKLEWKWEEVRRPAEAWKLELRCERVSSGVRVEVWYAGERYEREEMKWLVRRYERVVEVVASGASVAAAAVELLSAEEREQQVVAWNRTARAYPSDKCVQQLFEQQVAERPEAVAVVYEEEQLTYAELNARANRLAHQLRALGVGPEVLVGICVERSVEMIVGLLGILKAGGAYLPLDPSYPRPRLEYMLADAGATVLLTQQQLLPLFAAASLQVVCVDEETPQQWSSENPVSVSAPENLCYVIYTSGSTGQPKGVLVPQSALVNYCHAVCERLGEPLPASFATVSTFAADLGHTAIFPALSRGAALHVIAEARVMDAQGLANYFTQHEVDCLKIVPSHLRALYSLAGGQVLPRKVLIVGGEATQTEWAREWQEAWPECRLVNHYGPTECTVGVLMNEAPAMESNARILSLGKPLSNTHIYVLDQNQKLTPIGVTGELYIGGDGVARGYLNRPELTAQKFIPDPFSGRDGARLYRTGDLVRYQSDGQLEFVGRVDEQVKVRGYRIELGEIEAALSQHPKVKQCVVLAKTEEDGEQRLVAYLVLSSYLCGASDSTYNLPNQLKVAHQNKNETDFLYQEIFERQGYFKHGITLPEHACVFDVGANIGLFSLFVGQEFPTSKIYAFEPIAALFKTLQTNVALHGLNARIFSYGLSDSEGHAHFTYYPRYTVMSGLSAYADAASEARVIKQYLANEEESGSESAAQLLAHSDELLQGRFVAEEQECRLRRLSDVIREEGVDVIDLLKVDVQRAELDVLRGIGDADWEKIGQVVIEVHDEQGTASEGRLSIVQNLLREKNFEIVVDQYPLLRQVGRSTVYAVRKGYQVAKHEARNGSATESPVLTLSELRSYLKERLPDYMIPTAFVQLEQLPLNRNGKIDRDRLPAPEEVTPDKEANYVAPRTPLEEIVAGIWSEVLKLERVGPTQNFFELGGHSLLAMQVISRIRQVCQIDLPLLSLFEKPTVAGLSECIEAAIHGDNVAPPMVRVDRQRALPLSFAQRRLWFIHQLEPDSPAYNVPLSVRLQGELNIDAFEQTLSEIVRRHEVLRTTFSVMEGEPVQVIAPAAPVKARITDLSAWNEQEREREIFRLTDDEARRPFDLSTGPMLRVQLLKVSDREHVLLCTMHHIVSDGWSMGLLMKEVATLYRALCDGEPSPLPELGIQYADFAVWQREWLKGDVLASELSYWKEQLRGAPEVLELPADRPRSTDRSYRGARYNFKLSLEVSQQLKELARREGATLFMALLTGYSLLLSRYSGQEDIVVGSPIANRNRIEIEGLIGFFINNLCMRIRFSGDPSFRELLARVRKTCLEAYAHQDLPFERIVEELQPERDLGRSPLFQTTFGLRNLPNENLDLTGLSLRPVTYSREIVRLDLTLWMWDTPQGLGGVWAYSSDLFDAPTIQRLQDHFAQLLQNIVAQPDAPLSTLEMITEAEKEIRASERKEREQLNANKLKTSRRRALV